MMYKKVLVTGADGFIGSHLTERLVHLGYNVRTLVLYNPWNSWGWLDFIDEQVKKELEIVLGDIRDAYRVRKLVQGCDAVLHLASLIAIPYSYESPESYVDTNIKGTLNILEAVKELEIGKLVHTSSSEVYGTAQFVPIRENHPLRGQSPYAASKIGADQMALSFYYAFKTQISIIRPFNTYGPRQSTRAIIPTIITQVLNGKNKICLGCLSPTRDFNYVEDVVEGFIKVLESEKSVGETINIGNCFEISMKDLGELIFKIMGVEVEIKEELSRLRPKKSEVERLLADNRKAKILLGWESKHTGLKGLKNGLEKTIYWFRENIGFYKNGIYHI